jgi:NMD protein affecting ribosome stability and mRNA decay
LAGAHQSVACASCHKNDRYAGLPGDCFSCHQQTYDQATIPNHVTGKLSHDCITCHSMNAWKPSTFDHNKTAFALLGAHQTADCASCHKNGQFKGLTTNCYTCHLAEYSRSTTANHVKAQFSHDCTACHTMNVWKPSTFDHQKTNFPLLERINRRNAHRAIKTANLKDWRRIVTRAIRRIIQDPLPRTMSPHSSHTTARRAIR